jgi:hypothetical protein
MTEKYQLLQKLFWHFEMVDVVARCFLNSGGNQRSEEKFIAAKV